MVAQSLFSAQASPLESATNQIRVDMVPLRIFSPPGDYSLHPAINLQDTTCVYSYQDIKNYFRLTRP